MLDGVAEGLVLDDSTELCITRFEIGWSISEPGADEMLPFS